MQKFVNIDTISVGGLDAGAGTVALELDIPEEILIKRCVINCVNLENTNPFEVAIVQTDEFGSATSSDRFSKQRLVRTEFGAPGSPVNLDFTLTMRKLAGSSVAVVIFNHGAGANGFITKATYHYLEV